ncbi:hypothetical protein KP509_24G012200 [Ceratopteris richardii]|uniref:Ubiquitin carboxyl-terminal hydrolase n=1 Tax=Ceratopteris richardii TaxID=49495 RepID=A0A8T2RSI9_CERRI|nr:hypothetical protein KP509_24G012200 [Ceratopteris richardii]
MGEEVEAMEVLRTQLSKVRIPDPSSRIYKQECCISFENPRSEGGLYVDLCSFLAFGKDYVPWQYEKTGNSVYLNIKEYPKLDNDDRPYKKPTLLGIGVEGGFNTDEQKYETTYKITILPTFLELPYPNVQLPEKVRLAVDGVLAAVGAERKEQVAAWTAEKKRVSAFACNLQQLENGVQVPPTGWKCAKCDKVENLWLNLTDGMILCGRRNWDGSGGNNHAVQHYQETKYPLAVKLGTITADLEAADVYSYIEDDSVEDPWLAQHLAHFGIDFSSLKKTEMTTAERELDQNVNFDWNRIQESGKDLEPLHGPGYTGLINLGNSCYLASLMQVIFSTKSFQERYFTNLPLKEAFEKAPSDPTMDLNTQMAKLAHGLLSGKYSLPNTKMVNSGDEADSAAPEVEQKGIPPSMFKALIGMGHPEFGSSRQQDALEFFQHLLDHVERCHSANSQRNPSRSFKFFVEERIACSSSGKVKYNKRADNVLSLNIPLEAAINKDEMSSFLKKKAEREAAGEKLLDEEMVRPRVPLSACLENFSASEQVLDFYSSAISGRTMAIKSSRLATFPEFLVLHMRKFVMEAGWVPKKLDVFVDVPDTLNINFLRSKGLQPDEELLPESTEDHVQHGPVPDELIVSQLMEMGFPRIRCEKAALNTSNTGIDPAMQWLLSHMDDPDIDAPLETSSSKRADGSASTTVNEEHVETLVSFGFQPEQARRALRETGGDVERAAEWIFTHPDEINAMDVDADNSLAAATSVPEESYPDGAGEYKLLGFVSHMGTSTQCGHYVAHVLKEGRWVIYNDAKVAASGDPPKDMGYLYFYQRL